MNNQQLVTNPQHIEEILSRGVVEILPSTRTLSALLQEKRLRIYLGIDPTGSLLTLGHSVVLRKLQQFADLGHEVILLIGNGTVRIGDPTGKDVTRPELTDEQIRENFTTWKEQASKVLDFSKIEIRYNGDWLDKLSFSDVIKLMAKTTVQQLLERDMFQKRLEEGKPIHGHEIMYPLLQGYDSVVMDVDLEIGGNDQTFNMMMGRTLQKAYNNREKWVLATPLINGTDGRKMSKSFGNFIALTENSHDMYGKLMSTADEEIITYFEVLTDIPMSDVQDMAEKIKQGHNPMEFKKLLAFTITEMYHDVKSAQLAQEYFEKTVQNKEVPLDAPEFSKSEIAGKTILEMLKLFMPEESVSNIRRLIEQGGVQDVTTQTKLSDPHEVAGDHLTVIKVGKRKYFRLK